MTPMPIRYVAAFLLVTTFTVRLVADDGVTDGHPGAKDGGLVELTVGPAAAPTPLFRYRLLPANYDQVDGNAAPIYLRLVHEQRDEWLDTLSSDGDRFISEPIHELDVDALRAYATANENLIEQLSAAALRSHCDFEYVLEGVDPIMILLPDVQTIRVYGRFLAARARYQLLSGDFDAAVNSLHDGLALARHTSEAPFLICDLVGIAIARMMFSVMEDFVAQPDAPNLYWALTALPQPLTDVCPGLEFESIVLRLKFPELADIDRSRTPEQWQRLHDDIIQWSNEIREMNLSDDQKDDDGTGPEPDPQRLAAGRAELAERYGLNADAVGNMSDAEVAVRHIVYLSRETSDEILAAVSVPFWQSGPLFDRIDSEIEPRLKNREIYPAIYQALMISVRNVALAPAILEQHRRMLTVVEAIRLHATDTGELPATLDDVTVVPVPLSYYTNQPFDYQLAEGSATLSSPPPAGGRPANARTYTIRVRD